MANVNGTSASEGLIGGNSADLIRGLAGNDTIFGLDGGDTLDGGLGADSLTGGKGNDVYIIDNVGDRIVENASEGLDLVQSNISYSLANNVESLNLVGTSAINGTGNSLNNTILGNGANNILNGGAGNDNLQGLGGNDQLIGGTGKDKLDGGFGNDTLTGSSSSGIGIIGDVDTLTGGLGADTFSLVASNGSPAYIYDGDPDQGGYAVITDFNISQGDKIRLDGYASQYQLVGSSGRTDLFYIGPQQDQFELVAKISGVNLNNAYLNTTAFQYV